MAAGFEVRTHSTVIGTLKPEAMFTIQVLADPGWADQPLSWVAETLQTLTDSVIAKAKREGV